ncbi:MAG TPA: apolipoprotein N-acyltransferase [Cytophagales bacterium]|nr:apolipoprotein N-acyltransferase [Cytophagales bacterium]
MKSSWFWKAADGAKRPTAALEWGLVLLSALLLWAGWPAGGWPGLLFLAFSPLLALTEYLHAGGYRKPGRRLGWRIYVALLLWNILCTGWVANATLVGAAFMVLLNALLMLLPWLIYSWMKKQAPRIALFTGLLAYLSLEYAHMHWEMAWPWLNLGFGFANVPGWVQWYDLTGVLGGSLWILLANGAFYYVFWKQGAILEGKVRWLSLIYTVLLVIGIPLLISQIRGNRLEAEGTPVEVVLLQPNHDPYTNRIVTQPEIKTSPDKIAHYLTQTESAITPNTRWVLWPESTLPGRMWEHDTANRILQQVQTWVDAHPQLTLVTGATSLTRLNNSDPSRPYTITNTNGDRYEFHNSAIWVRPHQAPEFYHKSVLVPGVEVLPFASILQPIIGPIMEALGGTSGGYAPQAERAVFRTTDSSAISPTVCYESIFGDHTAKHVRNGSQAIGLVTNDAWWGETAGHRQHFAYARLLAISLRKPVLRAANTGISAFIHADGSVHQATEYYTEAVLRDTVLFSDQLTPYARHGDSLGRLAYGLLFFLWGSAWVQRLTKRKK